MGVLILECVVEEGQIRLPSGIRLSEHTRVYVLVPDTRTEAGVHVATPRLAHPEQTSDFQMETVEEAPDAAV